MTFVRTICAVALSVISACAFAQPDRYPSKPIKLVVGFPPGGGADIVGRLVAKHLGDALGQPVIIDNRGGASGFIAASAVAQAAPDGYTLLLGHVNALAIAPAASAKLPYDTLKDFSAIGYIGYAPNVLVVNPNVTSAKSVKELIDLVKSKPGELAYASPGVGSANHIAAVMFTSATKTSMVHVPYRGSAPAITDLLGGQVTMNFDAMTSVVNYVKEGRMRALAVTTKERNPQLPDVPTMQEQGIKDFDVTIWYSLMGPAGMPKALVTLLNDKLNDVLRKPDVKKQLAELGVTVRPLSPDQVTSLIRTDIAKYSSVVKQNNIRMD